MQRWSSTPPIELLDKKAQTTSVVGRCDPNIDTNVSIAIDQHQQFMTYHINTDYYI